MEKFPFLHLVVRFGRAGSLGAAIVAFALAVWLTWTAAGAGAILLGGIAGVFIFVVLRVLVELVTLVTEMLLPH